MTSRFLKKGSNFIGVYPKKRGWLYKINNNNKIFKSKIFPTEIEAAKAYDINKIKLFPNVCHTKLNFPSVLKFNDLENINNKKPKKKRKKRIDKRLREEVWIKEFGKIEKKCAVVWCNNKITPFDFQCGHNIPESKGGPTHIDNLFPICAQCNKQMSNKYTIDQWNKRDEFNRFNDKWYNKLGKSLSNLIS